MGVPLLLTWLRSNFGICVTYVAPRQTGWGRKTIQQQSKEDGQIGEPIDRGVPHQLMSNSEIPLTPKSLVSVHNIYRTDKAKSFDNVYIDLNSLLYQSVSLVVQRGLKEANANGIHYNINENSGTGSSSIGYEVETKILAQLMLLLDEVLFMTNPTALVYIAVDGVSPMGKMSQQRNRRAASVKMGMHMKVKQLMGWDSNCITSGTLFMERVTQILHYYAVSRVEMANNINNQPNFTGCLSDFLLDRSTGSSIPKGAIPKDGASCERKKIGMFFADASDNIVKVSEAFSAMAISFYGKTSPLNKYNATEEGSQQPVFSITGGTGGVGGMSNNNSGAVLSPGVTIVVNDVCIAGEGEHKIIDAIRSFRRLWRNPCNINESGNSCNSEDSKLFFAYPPASNLGNTQGNVGGPSDVSIIYSPNTTHCVVSPDTDVVVCSLALHEPHIDVFWYSGQDPEDSQFFSILLFRQILKGKLGFGGTEKGHPFNRRRQALITDNSSEHLPSTSDDRTSRLLQYFKPWNTMGFPSDKIEKDEGENSLNNEICHRDDPKNEDRRIFFEETLHDLIFILLLFGNDFLPKLSVDTDIGSGLLDKLLEFLLTDFVSRGKHIVDARTGKIDLSAAKYVISHCAKHSSELSVMSHSGGAFDPFQCGNDINSSMDTQKTRDLIISRVALSTSGSLNQQRHGAINSNGNKVQVCPNKIPLTENERAEMCYDYWDGLQWTMLYCTGACPSWSWHYKHTVVPPVEDLIKYCKVRDNIFSLVTPFSKESVSVTSPQTTDHKSKTSPLLVGSDIQSYVLPGLARYKDCMDQSMDVFTQLILLMPPESRHLLPASIIDAYTNELSSAMAGVEFEKLDLHAITKWSYIQRKRLSATDSRRMASFEPGKYPLIVRWPYEAEKAFFPSVSKCSSSLQIYPAVSDSQQQKSPLGGLFSKNQLRVTSRSAVNLDDLLGDSDDNDENVCDTEDDKKGSVNSQILPDVPSVQSSLPEKSSPSILQSWVPVAGPFTVAPNTAFAKTSQCGVSTFSNSTALVSFFFLFNENLHLHGISSVNCTYRCGDTSAEKQCASVIHLKPDWIKRRPMIQIGECRDVPHNICDKEQNKTNEETVFTVKNIVSPSLTLPHNSHLPRVCYRIPPDQPFLLPCVKEIPKIRKFDDILANYYNGMRQNRKYGVKRERSNDNDEVTRK